MPFTVLVNGDVTPEANEQFFVNLTKPVGAVLADAQGVATINNDDFALLTIDSVVVRESAVAPVDAVFTVRLNTASEQTVTVKVATINLDAQAGSDYVGIPLIAPQTLTFTPGQTKRTITVTVLPDAKRETAEHFLIVLFDAGNALPLIPIGLGTIIDSHQK